MTGEDDLQLFRRPALAAAARPIAGEPGVSLPRIAAITAVTSASTVTSILLALWVVKIPVSVQATGVIMPSTGLVEITAPAAGTVEDVFIEAGQRLDKGDPIAVIRNQRGEIETGFAASHAVDSLSRELKMLSNKSRAEASAHQLRKQSLLTSITATQTQIRAVREREELQRKEIGVIASRISRLKDLAGKGAISRESVEREHQSLYAQQQELLGIREQIVTLEAARDSLARESELVAANSSIAKLQHSVTTERVLRALSNAKLLDGRKVRSHTDLTVVEVLVSPAAFVIQGQTLARAHHPGAETEAWLYVRSASAARLENGQIVVIDLAGSDDVPRTLEATVASVSKSVLLPRDTNAPLNIAGPVFEVRAKLQEDDLVQIGWDNQRPIGLAFEAKIVQQEYSLINWVRSSVLGVF